MLALMAYWTADLAVRALPASVADAIARMLARGAFAVCLPARRALESNLTRLLSGSDDPSATPPEAPRRASAPVSGLARAGFEHFALAVTDFLRLARIRRGTLWSTIELRGAEHLAAARTSGRGVIVLSAHVGNWEWGAAYLADLGQRVHIAARPHRSRGVEAFYSRRRSSWGVTSLRERPLWLSASRALRRGEWVALMGDRGVPGGRGSLCSWASALARRTGAMVLPALMIRIGRGRYAACFETPLTPETCAQGGFLHLLRRHVARAPEQWCAFEPLPEGLT
jgi:lauroyl/myristoyl acyltransferase